MVGAGRLVDRGFGGNDRMVIVAVERGRVGSPDVLRRDDEERNRVAR